MAVEAREDWKTFQLQFHEMVKALLTRQMRYCAVAVDLGLDRGSVRLQGRYTGFAKEMLNGHRNTPTITENTYRGVSFLFRPTAVMSSLLLLGNCCGLQLAVALERVNQLLIRVKEGGQELLLFGHLWRARGLFPFRL